ncbi:hypothetical protein [Agrococcus sp. HG114]|uniref:hypothetical protein n=1 Tax=Agrococcus sp. HG114 TaxID=2969757 RepID=UPI00215A8E73|nr:hypothetical protein [Agrococcus sp. HG114]MCR8669808.1 hypothetical protein [Agrococcus sp. HG114]
MPIPPQLAKLLKLAPGLVQEYGPELIKWAREHPDFVRDLVEQVKPRPRPRPSQAPGDAGGAGAEPAPVAGGRAGDIGETIATMRMQIAYLAESADDTAERERAEAWRAKIDRLDRANSLIASGGSSAEREQLAAQVEQLRAAVVAAFLAERIEDEGGPSPSDAGR